MTQMRFQPCQGKYLAAAAENLISILDVETQAIYSSLQVIFLDLCAIFHIVFLSLDSNVLSILILFKYFFTSDS
jgi:hypothetical protein